MGILKLRHIPNLISFIRIFLVIPFVYYFIHERYTAAFYLFMLAGASDGLDGILARQFQWTSRLGSFIDPIADKLLMITTYSLLAWLGAIPLWLFVIVILRDVIILSGVGGVIYILGDVDIEPSLVSKLNTVLQVLLAGFLLFELSYQALPDGLIHTLMGLLVTTSVLSVTGYFIEGVKQAFFKQK